MMISISQKRMKNGLRIMLTIGLGAGLLASSRAAEAPAAPPAPGAPAAPAPSPFKDQKEKLSYAVGMSVGTGLKRGSFEVDLDTLFAAMKDALAGKELKLTDQQVQEVFRAHQMEARAKAEEENKKKAEKNKIAGAAFLEENKTKPGVKIKTVTLPDGKTAELQYKVLTEGTGAVPGSNDMVSVNYRGTTIDGKEFDSSAKHGDKPAKFPVKGVVRGWTEALEMMPVGSKWEVYLPTELAYNDRPMGTIEPGSTLIFEMELVGSEAAPAPTPPPTPQPLTSDIIKVPSADEMQKGAKIEVIKAEEAARMAATNNPSKQ
jgi:FKBP-type peptidyl-prolyl cis-trans isomerase